MRYVFGLMAIGMMLLFLVPIMLKIKEVTLTVVILIGLVMMVIDMWQDRPE